MTCIRTPLIASLATLAIALGACSRDAGTAAPTNTPAASSAAPASGTAVASVASAGTSAQRCITQPSAPASTDKPPVASDKPQPGLQVTTFDCRHYNLADQRGHWVIVNFWATWCGPCLQEIPDLTRFVRARKDVTAIGLDSEDGIDVATLEAFVKQHAPGYPIAVIDPYRPPQDFESPRALPTSYLIGPDGKVVHKFLGPITFADLERMVGPPKTRG